MFLSLKALLPETIKISDSISFSKKLAKKATDSIYTTRQIARHYGHVQMTRQFPQYGLVKSNDSLLVDAAYSQRLGDKFGRDWYRKLKYEGDGLARAPKFESRVDTIAITESSTTYSDERAAIAREQIHTGLIEIWDATLDRRTCKVCEGLDGERAINGEFPGGQRPGSVHPRCRCCVDYEVVSKDFYLLPYIAAGATYGWL